MVPVLCLQVTNLSSTYVSELQKLKREGQPPLDMCFFKPLLVSCWLMSQWVKTTHITKPSINVGRDSRKTQIQAHLSDLLRTITITGGFPGGIVV